MGTKPSYIWQSIHSAQEILNAGLYWRIGNGENIYIWKTKWVALQSTYSIHSPPCIMDGNARVKDLFDIDTQGWNFPLIESIFQPGEVRAIKTIPLSITN